MDNKFSENDLKLAIGSLSMLKFFPSDAGARAAVQKLLAKICPGKFELEWLVDRLILLNEWPGPGQVRGLLCTRYKPADGIEADCALPGYRPEDYEARALDEHEQLQCGGYTEEAMSYLEAAKPKLLK